MYRWAFVPNYIDENDLISDASSTNSMTATIEKPKSESFNGIESYSGQTTSPTSSLFEPFVTRIERYMRIRVTIIINFF